MSHHPLSNYPLNKATWLCIDIDKCIDRNRDQSSVLQMGCGKLQLNFHSCSVLGPFCHKTLVLLLTALFLFFLQRKRACHADINICSLNTGVVAF